MLSQQLPAILKVKCKQAQCQLLDKFDNIIMHILAICVQVAQGGGDADFGQN